jgi:PDZ domain-containing secreted protein
VAYADDDDGDDVVKHNHQLVGIDDSGEWSKNHLNMTVVEVQIFQLAEQYMTVQLVAQCTYQLVAQCTYQLAEQYKIYQLAEQCTYQSEPSDEYQSEVTNASYLCVLD